MWSICKCRSYEGIAPAVELCDNSHPRLAQARNFSVHFFIHYIVSVVTKPQIRIFKAKNYTISFSQL